MANECDWCHGKIAKFQCPYCGKFYHKNECMSEHQKVRKEQQKSQSQWIADMRKKAKEEGKYFCETCQHFAREGIDKDNEDCCSYKCWISCSCRRCKLLGGEKMAKKCVGCGKDTKNALRDKMVTQAKEGKQ